MAASRASRYLSLPPLLGREHKTLVCLDTVIAKCSRVVKGRKDAPALIWQLATNLLSGKDQLVLYISNIMPFVAELHAVHPGWPCCFSGISKGSPAGGGICRFSKIILVRPQWPHGCGPFINQSDTVFCMAPACRAQPFHRALSALSR